MRLFTAIMFEEDLKTSLYKVTERLRSETMGGSFTHKDNLHLTINFIGETDRVELVKQIMSRAVLKSKAKRFFITIQGFGRFRRREGDICFVGVEKEQKLWDLQKALAKELLEEGFQVDDHEYKPHLTLSRRTVFKRDIDDKAFGEMIESIKMSVTKISLMKSERIQGKLVYTEIYQVELE